MSTTTLSNPTRTRCAASSTTAASVSDPGRNPWSTWTAVTLHPAASARTISEMESAPPDRAHVTWVPGGGKVHLASRSSKAGSASANERPHAVEPVLRVADLFERREVDRRQPAHVDGVGPGLGLDRGDESLARRVLVELALDA